MNDIFTGVVLGIVEGLTEYIPVSSTGHLILIGNFIKFTGPVADTFEIFIQFGCILAVLVLYLKRFLGLFDFSRRDGFSGKPGILKITLACIPAFIFGYLFHKQIKELLFSPRPVAWALIVGGLLMILVERVKPKVTALSLAQISPFKALLIGICQCLSLWPGMSRSGSTIMGGMIFGLDRKVAAEFSFIVAVPVMTAAVAHDLLKSISFLHQEQITLFASGFLVSFVAGLGAIRLFLRLLSSVTLVPFAIYRIIVGGLVLWLAT